MSTRCWKDASLLTFFDSSAQYKQILLCILKKSIMVNSEVVPQYFEKGDFIFIYSHPEKRSGNRVVYMYSTIPGRHRAYFCKESLIQHMEQPSVPSISTMKNRSFYIIKSKKIKPILLTIGLLSIYLRLWIFTGPCITHGLLF